MQSYLNIFHLLFLYAYIIYLLNQLMFLSLYLSYNIIIVYLSYIQNQQTTHQYTTIKYQMTNKTNNNNNKTQQLKQDQFLKQYNTIKQKQQNQWQVITTLNKLYKVDRILLKHAYDNYSDKQILQKTKQYKNIQKFYRYVFDNLFKIQKSYLNDQIGLNQGDIHNNNNYQINKNSTSKFIRDQKQNYQEVLKKYLQKVNQDQFAIQGTKLYQFVKDCFSTKFTKVIIGGEEYFGKNDGNRQEFQDVVKNYYCNVKDIEESSFRLENVWMGEDQILDFLSEWLKYYEGKDLYVLYCRTQEKLKKDIEYLKKQAQKNRAKQVKGQKPIQITHPLNLTKQNQESINIPEQIRQPTQNQQQNKKQQQKIQNEPVKASKISNILQKYRKNKFLSQQNPIQQTQIKPRIKTKKQQFLDKLPQLFQQGCRKRYVLNKNTTFDHIQNQTKKMNLQKFINFCNFFGINAFLSRELLTEIFKINAVNRLVIDQKRFIKIMQTISSTDQKTIDCFLAKKQPKKLKSQSKLSNYRFMLRPVNGKSVQNLQIQIQQKKTTKQKNKQQKMNLYFLKKLKQKQRGNYKKQKVVLSSRVLPDSTSINQLQNIRDDKFDPQKFFGNDYDQMLSVYESKFLSSKDQITPLQSILSKRLQKGTKILKKINSSSLKGYQ